MRHFSILSLATLFVALCFSTSSHAQTTFSHAGGASIYVNSGVAAPAVLYSPRLNFELDRDLTLSVGTHIGLGFSGSANSRTGNGISVALDLPVLAEINWGQGSSPDSYEDFGLFGGAGFGYNRMSQTIESAFGTTIASSPGAWGPVFNIGARAMIARTYPVGLRLAYMLNLRNTGGSNVYSIGAFYTFGSGF